MNRQELIDAIAAETEASKAATGRFLDSLLSIVQKEVCEGRSVKLAGFGTFGRASVAAREGRNPKTGQQIKIPARHKARFTPGSAFKELLKG